MNFSLIYSLNMNYATVLDHSPTLPKDGIVVFSLWQAKYP